jgi:hypothetical protein
VGSFKKGTILSNRKTADLVVVLKTLPTKTAVEALGKKCKEDLAKEGIKRRWTARKSFNGIIFS